VNLIEQLGGYERAKNHRDYLIDFGNEFNRPNKYEVNKINNALLEYRRQHNIFEEGDKVIYLILGNDVITYDDWLKTQNSNLIRHATPEEIAAGKRLEVNQ